MHYHVPCFDFRTSSSHYQGLRGWDAFAFHIRRNSIATLPEAGYPTTAPNCLGVRRQQNQSCMSERLPLTTLLHMRRALPHALGMVLS